MVKDPVCGMEVSKEKAKHMIFTEHETFHFCSEQCKASYAKQLAKNRPTAQKGILGRFLEKLAKENKKSYGSKPPTCH